MGDTAFDSRWHPVTLPLEHYDALRDQVIRPAAADAISGRFPIVAEATWLTEAFRRDHTTIYARVATIELDLQLMSALLTLTLRRAPKLLGPVATAVSHALTADDRRSALERLVAEDQAERGPLDPERVAEVQKELRAPDEEIEAEQVRGPARGQRLDPEES